jgi:hypothetical protein
MALQRWQILNVFYAVEPQPRERIHEMLWETNNIACFCPVTGVVWAIRRTLTDAEEPVQKRWNVITLPSPEALDHPIDWWYPYGTILPAISDMQTLASLPLDLLIREFLIWYEWFYAT